MYSKSVIIKLAVIIIHTEAGIITNAFGLKSNTSLIDSNKKQEKIENLSKPLKKYSDVNLSPAEYKKNYERTDKLNLSNNFLIMKNIPQVFSDAEKSRINIPPELLKNDDLQSKREDFKDNMEIGAAIDEIYNQQIIKDSIVEYLDLDSYPNLLDKVAIPTAKNISHSPQITNFDGDQAVVISDVAEFKNEGNTNNEQVFIQNKTETILDKQYMDTIVSTKYDDKSISEEDRKDFAEFIFITKDVNKPEFVTESNFDYFEITADVLIEEPRFKRSVNIIEEENLGTTASGIKYTGQYKILNDDLHFKNINS